jgi:citrate synthase
MQETATLTIGDKKIELPVIIGSEGECAINIQSLRKETGYITMDPGLANTGICKSEITFMDGEKGILRYRGIPVEELAEHSTFAETAYLLVNESLPTKEQFKEFSQLLTDQSLVHEDLKAFYGSFPSRSHPMGILSSMVNALRSFYKELKIHNEEAINITLARLMSKVRTMAVMSYKISRGHTVAYPKPEYCYCTNFLYLLYHSPVREFEINPLLVKALNVFWILHADHEQNCSTSAVRLVGSGRVNLYAAISAGISALWGPLHGGANQAVIEMLCQIQENGGNIRPFIDRAKDRNDPFRLMGFGHRVYKTYDPRAKIIKKICHELLESLEIKDPLLDIAIDLEEAVLKDPYFIDHNLYPNVDFYSGIVLRAMRIPTNMFTVMFALGRMPGWIAQWKEDADNPNWKLYRPRQIYIGSKKRQYVPIDER